MAKAKICSELELVLELKKAKGVHLHNGRLRIQFALPDKASHQRVSLGLELTKKNITVALTKLTLVKADIMNGFYNNNKEEFWRKHFPTKNRIKTITTTVNDCFEEFIRENPNHISDSMLDKLRSTKSWLARFGLINLAISSISTDKINEARQTSVTTCRDSTIRGYTQILSKIINHALDKNYIKTNPMNKLKKLEKDDIDADERNKLILPFEKDELERLLKIIHIPQTKRMIEILVWTGLRHGELKALAWEDIDFKSGTIKVKYNLTRKGNLKPPKTQAGIREITLLPRALELLKLQKQLTFELPRHDEIIHLRNQKTKIIKRRRIFLTPDNKPYKRPELTSVAGQWKKWLEKAQFTHRPAYQLRHTYASMLLTAGAQPAWLANQMGHRNWGMIQNIYGKWMSSHAPNYINVLASKLGQSFNSTDVAA